MPSLRQRRQRRSRQQQQRGGRRSARRGVPSNVETNQSVDPALVGGRRRGARRFSRRGVPTLPVEPVEDVAVMNDGEIIPVSEVPSNEVGNIDEVVQMPADTTTGGRSRRLRRGRRASRAAQRGGRAVSLKTAVRLLRNYYAKRYA